MVGVLALLTPVATTSADETTDPQNMSDLIQPAPKTKVPADAAKEILPQKGPVTVMVELAEDPVAVVKANKGGSLSEGEEKQIQEKLSNSQDKVAAQVTSLGGAVENRLQSAYNGLRVTIDSAQVADVEGIDGVKSVQAIPVHARSNTAGVPYIGSPNAWQGAGGTGYTGKGVKIAIIDSGIDYTHATFGGEGTPDAFIEATAATDPTPYYDSRVKGGYDFAGDLYTGQNTPQPDNNPIDCEKFGHGTHVAATAAGSGVTADGETYKGPYDSTTHNNEFRVGPGVAPEADLYALKIFGCEGHSSLTADAVDWAVKNHMDVINLSLGSPFGRATDPDAVAVSNAVAAGVVVVSAAGNAGSQPYLTSSPGTGAGVVSVAANDPMENYPAAQLTIDGKTIQTINVNGAKLPQSAKLHVLRTEDNKISTGCDRDEYASVPRGAIVVTRRGDCARVLRAMNAQRWGLAGAIMINDSDELPPYEGLITGNPETGEKWRVNVPLLGVKSSDTEAIVAAHDKEVTLTANEIPNRDYGKLADFSSAGPRSGDSAVRPNVTAPGVSILSAAVGAGSLGRVDSGTSMATPHVTGVAALAVQAHPEWSAQEIAASLVNTADPEKVGGYDPTLAGGLVDPVEAVGASVVAYGDSTDVNGTAVRDAGLSFGYAESSTTFEATRKVTLVNKGTETAQFTASSQPAEKSKKATISFSQEKITVPAGGSVDVDVKITVSASDVPSGVNSPNSPWFYEASGNLKFTGSGGKTLTMPYLLVPRSLSNVKAANTPTPKGTDVTFTNEGGAVGAYTAIYTWGLSDPADIPDGVDSGQDLASVGVASYGDETLRTVNFALNSSSRFSNPAQLMYNVEIDNDNDGKADYRIISIDSGLVRAKEINGVAEVFVADLSDGKVYASGSMTLAPTDSSTVVLQVVASQVGIKGKFSYTAYATDLKNEAAIDTIEQWAQYDPTNKPFNDGQFFKANPGESKTFNLERNDAAYTDQKTLGYMAVAFDNAQGVTEAITGELNKGTEPTASPSTGPTSTVTPTGTASPTGTATPTSTDPGTPGQPTRKTPVRPGLPRTGEGL